MVDDQQDERIIQRTMLTHLGYDVREAVDGQAGLEAARASPPDLVLMDVAMPRMDGFEACRQLRDDPRTQAIPVLLFTASLVGEVSQRAEKAGASGILSKPVDPHEVADEIERLLREGES